jgi:hypothetical protein
MGIIKKLFGKNLAGYSSSDTTEIYPVTSSDAVYTNNNEKLTDVLDDLKACTQTIDTATASAYSSDKAAVTVKLTDKSTIDFKFGIPNGKDAVVDYDTIKDYINSNKVSAWIQYVYRATDSLPDIPIGGSYNFETKEFIAPTGWSSDVPEGTTIWMSIRVFYSDDSETSWSTPIKVSGDLLSSLVQAYVAVIYKYSEEIPDTPTGGTYNFTYKVFTPPTGWSSTPIGGDNTWYSLKVFYSDGTESNWSTPQEGTTANVELTYANLEVIAGKIALTENELEIIACKVELSSEEILTVAKNIELTAESLQAIADKVTLSTSQLEWIASKVNLTTDQLVTVAKNCKFTTDDLEIIGKNVIVSNALLEVIANNVQLSTDDLKVVASNVELDQDNLAIVAKNVKLDSDDLAVVASNVELTSDQINVIADKVDLSGSLSSKDLTINGGASKFNADGSGSVANGNITWDTNGDVTMKGAINAVKTILEITTINNNKEVLSSSLNAVDENVRNIVLPDMSTLENGETFTIAINNAADLREDNTNTKNYFKRSVFNKEDFNDTIAYIWYIKVYKYEDQFTELVSYDIPVAYRKTSETYLSLLPPSFICQYIFIGNNFYKVSGYSVFDLATSLGGVL